MDLLVYSTSIFLLYLIIPPHKKKLDLIIIQKNAFSRVGVMIRNEMSNSIRQRLIIKYFENQRQLCR